MCAFEKMKLGVDYLSYLFLQQHHAKSTILFQKLTALSYESNAALRRSIFHARKKVFDRKDRIEPAECSVFERKLPHVQSCQGI